MSDSAATTARDTHIAIRSALMLGSSLIATWSVALLVRLYLPRYLGPEIFGVYNFADSFAATFFVALGLGMETYIQKEIPVRPEHATDFFGGVMVVRFLMSAALIAAMSGVLAAANRPAEVQRVVFAFGVAQFVVQLNVVLAALLHASRNVGKLAIWNVASKILWGVGVAAALILNLNLIGLAFAFLASEVIKAGALWRLAREHLDIRWKIDWKVTKSAILSSLPFYLNAIAITAYAKVDVTILTLMSNNSEVGWYSSASNFAGLAMLLSPLIGSVLMPLMSRAAARSEEELLAIQRRAIEGIMSLAIPVSLMVSVGADVWVHYAFGDKFWPATRSLAILGPMFILTYLAIIGATYLVLTNRAWTVTLISLGGLALNPILNTLVVPWSLARFGPGGAGVGAASVMITTEAFVTVAFMGIIGLRCFDLRSVVAIGKSCVAAAVVVLLDRAIRPLGPARLFLDFGAYVAIALGTGAVRIGEVREMVKQMVRNRAQARAQTNGGAGA